MNLEEILNTNNTQLKQNELIIRGQIESLKEELIKVRAKIAHNTDLLEILTRVQNTDTAVPDIEEQQN